MLSVIFTVEYIKQTTPPFFNFWLHCIQCQALSSSQSFMENTLQDALKVQSNLLAPIWGKNKNNLHYITQNDGARDFSEHCYINAK